MASTRVPERTCVGCRRPAPKHELIRIARTGTSVALDTSGSAPGRGAYVHPDAGCARAALAHSGLSRALRMNLGPGELGRLQGDIERQIGAL